MAKIKDLSLIVNTLQQWPFYIKKGEEKIKNWRSLSLLNVDPKILSKTFAETSKTVLPKHIHTNQRGWIKSRYAGENIRLVEDTAETGDKNQ